MQKVEGSSPFIRFENPRKSGVFVCRHDYVSPRCVPRLDSKLRLGQPVGFANSGGLVFVDESAEEIPTLYAIGRVQRRRVAAAGREEA
jgi:hypothetical protein